MTDNKNRTVSELRRALTRGGGALGESGSVAWLFEQKGLITVAMGPKDQDKIFEAALDAGAEDVQYGDGVAEVYTMPADLQTVRQAFIDGKYKVEDAEVIMQAKTQVSLSPADTLQVLNLVEAHRGTGRRGQGRLEPGDQRRSPGAAGIATVTRFRERPGFPS